MEEDFYKIALKNCSFFDKLIARVFKKIILKTCNNIRIEIVNNRFKNNVH